MPSRTGAHARLDAHQRGCLQRRARPDHAEPHATIVSSGSSTTARRPPKLPAMREARGQGRRPVVPLGNPLAYRAGTEADRRLFYQHDAHWIPTGRPAPATSSSSTTAVEAGPQLLDGGRGRPAGRLARPVRPRPGGPRSGRRSRSGATPRPERRTSSTPSCRGRTASPTAIRSSATVWAARSSR